MSQSCFRSKYFARVLHKSTGANYLLRTCDIKVRIAFAESMNQAYQLLFLVLKQLTMLIDSNYFQYTVNLHVHSWIEPLLAGSQGVTNLQPLETTGNMTNAKQYSLLCFCQLSRIITQITNDYRNTILSSLVPFKLFSLQQ